MNGESIEQAVVQIIKAFGDNPDREGLKGTPRRIAEMYESSDRRMRIALRARALPAATASGAMTALPAPTACGRLISIGAPRHL